MRAIMIVPTGIGASIGGHSGDATSVAHLMAECVDELIVHPNVLNASDLYCAPRNALYVEGSMIDGMLSGLHGLRTVDMYNRIAVVCNEITDKTVDAVNAARSVHGVSAKIVQLETPLGMHGFIEDDRAVGELTGVKEMIKQLKKVKCDAVAVHTPVEVEPRVVEHYMRHGGVNPWGGVEAILSKKVTRAVGVPCAHAPLEIISSKTPASSDPRLAPEMICGSHLVSVLAGLHKAPRRCRPGTGITVQDIDFLVSPMCWGAPHRMAMENGIDIILVRQNHTTQAHLVDDALNDYKYGTRVVENYLEAAGMLMAYRTGRVLRSVTSPLVPTRTFPCE